jgi:hypothetical protein
MCFITPGRKNSEPTFRKKIRTILIRPYSILCSGRNRSEIYRIMSKADKAAQHRSLFRSYLASKSCRNSIKPNNSSRGVSLNRQAPVMKKMSFAWNEVVNGGEHASFSSCQQGDQIGRKFTQ